VLQGGAGLGTTVVIQGPGQQGLACVIAAKETGAACIIASGLTRDAHRLELAKELGAHHTVDVEQQDLLGVVKQITGDRMADLVIDCASGGPYTVVSAIQLARKGGRVILGGQKRQRIPDFDSDLMIRKFLTLKGMRDTVTSRSRWRSESSPRDTTRSARCARTALASPRSARHCAPWRRGPARRDSLQREPVAMTREARTVISMTQKFLRHLTVTAGLLFPAAAAPAQLSYPAPGRIITIVVPFSLGTGPDILARLAGQKLGERWAASVIVDNKPGASGNIGAELVAKRRATVTR